MGLDLRDSRTCHYPASARALRCLTCKRGMVISVPLRGGSSVCIWHLPPPPAPSNGHGIVNPDLASQLLTPEPHLPAGWVAARGTLLLPPAEGRARPLGEEQLGRFAGTEGGRLRALRLAPGSESRL